MKTVLIMMAAAALSAEVGIPPEARTVLCGVRDIIPIYGKLLHSTIIVLPKSEVVVEAAVGDPDAWDVDRRQGTNLVSVKPNKASATNLNVITATGNVYSFVLQTGNSATDLKVFIEAKKDLALNGPVLFYPAAQVRAIEDRANAAEQKAALIAEQSRKEIKETAAAAQLAVQKAENDAPKNVDCNYAFESGKPPFNVETICHNGKFTYITARPWKTFVVWEKGDDGKPKVVEFLPEGPDKYVIYSVVRNGVLAIGKEQKMEFSAKR